MSNNKSRSHNISPPTTTGDAGNPSGSVLNDVNRIFYFIQDERHLVAFSLYQSVHTRLSEENERKATSKATKPSLRGLHRSANKREEKKYQEECERAVELLEARKSEIVQLENRARILRRAQQNLNVEEGWLRASVHFGITTYYRKEPDGSLSIKLEGEVTGIPLFEQIAVLRDIDLHHKWVPFCTSSMTVAHLDKLDIVGWFMVGVPQIGLARDGCFRVIGCDNMSEDGSVLIAGQGIHDRKSHHPQPEDTYLSDDPILDELDIPPPPTKRGNDRMTLKKFETVIHVTSATSATTRVVANIDPNIPFLSQGIIDFCMKHLCGVLLAKLQGAAKKIVRNPVSNPHAERMREEPEFYQKWLLAKFEAVAREKGWEMPVVAAFALTEEQLVSNRHYLDRRTRRTNTFGGVSTSTIDNDNASFESSPILGRNSSDSVSELSLGTAKSIWRDNPVANYIRESKEKKERLKAAEIAQARQRVANLMKPKGISSEDKARLERLTKARLRRQNFRSQSHESTPEDEGDVPTQPPLAVRVVSAISRSTLFRTLVMLCLVTLLFLMLQESFLLDKFWLATDSPESTFADRMKGDVGTVLYILGCGMVHYIVYDTALLYFFDALDFGRKAGVPARKYYSQNMRFLVMAASFSICFFSVLRGLWTIYAGWSLVKLIDGYNNLIAFISALADDLPENIKSSLALCSICWSQIVSALTQVVLFVGTFLYKYLIESSFAGRVVEKVASAVFGVGEAEGDEKSDSYEEELLSSSCHSLFRTKAFGTAEALFSYSAVFLPLALTLYYRLVSKTKTSGQTTDRGSLKEQRVGSTALPAAEGSGLSHIEVPARVGPESTHEREVEVTPSLLEQSKHSGASSSSRRLKTFRPFQRRGKGESFEAQSRSSSAKNINSKERVLRQTMTY